MTTKRAGLGRGLGALLPGAAEAKVLDLPVSEVKPNPHQPRRDFSEDELQELAASIREVGLLQPVVVRSTDDGFELLVGERRLRAARLAGLDRIPAIVREAEDAEALEQALVENLQRADLRALEEAIAFQNLIEIFELTQEEVARKVGKSRAHIANTLRLMDLPESVKAYLDSGALSAGHARAVLSIKDPALREVAARRAVEEGLTVRQVEAMARKETGSRPKQQARARRSHFPDLEESLSDHLGTEVAIEIGRGKGRIVIMFGSRDDLNRLAQSILQA